MCCAVITDKCNEFDSCFIYRVCLLHDVEYAVQTPEELKTPTGEEAFNADGLVQMSIRLLKDRFPDLEVCWHGRTLTSSASMVVLCSLCPA